LAIEIASLWNSPGGHVESSAWSLPSRPCRRPPPNMRAPDRRTRKQLSRRRYETSDCVPGAVRPPARSCCLRSDQLRQLFFFLHQIVRVMKFTLFTLPLDECLHPELQSIPSAHGRPTLAQLADDDAPARARAPLDHAKYASSAQAEARHAESVSLSLWWLRRWK